MLTQLQGEMLQQSADDCMDGLQQRMQGTKPPSGLSSTSGYHSTPMIGASQDFKPAMAFASHTGVRT